MAKFSTELAGPESHAVSLNVAEAEAAAAEGPGTSADPVDDQIAAPTRSNQLLGDLKSVTLVRRADTCKPAVCKIKQMTHRSEGI